jgi:hypothetical protein
LFDIYENYQKLYNLYDRKLELSGVLVGLVLMLLLTVLQLLVVDSYAGNCFYFQKMLHLFFADYPFDQTLLTVVE